MRVVLLLMVVMLAGCSDSKATSEATAPPVQAAEPAPVQEAVQDVTPAEPHPLLARRVCDLGRAYVTAPVAVDGIPMGATCPFVSLDVPAGAESARIHFNWSAAWAAQDLGISVRDTVACGEGGACELAAAAGPALVLDLTADLRGAARWSEIQAVVTGTSLAPGWSMVVLFYAAPDPGLVPPPMRERVVDTAFLGQGECATQGATVLLGAGSQDTGTSGVCKFAELDVPDYVRSARVWFNWTAQAPVSDLGLVLRDEFACDSGASCELARVEGPDSVMLDIPQALVGDARWSDLGLTVSGEAIQPSWQIVVLWFATPEPT
ncbi:MAG: hypothetical protein ACPHID_07010 [Thermoplasmatota archaeon]